MRRPRAAAIAAAGILAAGVAGCGSHSHSSSPAGQTVTPTTSAPAPSATGAPEVPTGWVRYRSAKTGFSLYYPPSWRRLATKSRSVALLVERDQSSSLLARASSVGLNVTPQTLPIARELTDGLVRADPTVKLLGEPQPISIGGMPGYRYVYTFGRGTTTPGAHVHYFLFHRGRMFTLVFQALPAAVLGTVEPEFTRVAESLRPVDP